MFLFISAIRNFHWQILLSSNTSTYRAPHIFICVLLAATAKSLYCSDGVINSNDIKKVFEPVSTMNFKFALEHFTEGIVFSSSILEHWIMLILPARAVLLNVLNHHK